MGTQKVIWKNRSLKSDNLKGWKWEEREEENGSEKWKEKGSEYININIDTVNSTKK